jgi:two-component system, OmpR family, sensor kinase
LKPRLRSIRAGLVVSFAVIIAISYGLVVVTAEFFIRNDRSRRHADLVADVVGLVHGELQHGAEGGLVGHRNAGEPLLDVLNDYSSVHALIWLHGPGSSILMPSSQSVGDLRRYANIFRAKGYMRSSSDEPLLVSENGHTFLLSATRLAPAGYTLYTVEDIGLTPVSDAESIRSLIVIWLSVTAVSLAVSLLLVDSSLRPLGQLESALQGALARDESMGDAGSLVSTEDFPVELSGIISAYLGLMERLHQVLSQKQLILSAMSHELLTPIAVLLGWARRLSRDGGQLSPDQQKLVADIVAELTRFNHLTTGLLAVSKGAISNSPSGRDVFSPVDVIISLQDDLKGSAFGHRLRFEQSREDLQYLREISCSGEADLFRQCVVNLIENAVKYSSADSLVEISCVADHAEVFSVRVRDHGPGIGAVEKDKIFRAFYRSPESIADQPGSGVGLALVELLMKKMGGRVALIDSSHSGSVFELTLPVLHQAG